MPAGVDASDDLGSGLLEQGQAPACMWIGHVDQVMWDAPAFFLRGLGSADIHAPVEETAIRRDDLGVQSFSQLDGNPGLANRGWTDDDNQRR